MIMMMKSAVSPPHPLLPMPPSAPAAPSGLSKCLIPLALSSGPNEAPELVRASQ